MDNSDKYCQYAGSCKQRNVADDFNDKPDTRSALGWRVIITFLSWCALGKAVSSETFFVAVFLFTVPILYDCIKFRPANTARRMVMWLELVIALFWVVFSFLGMAGILTFSANTNSMIQTADNYVGFTIAGVQVESVLHCLLSVLFVTILDFLCKVSSLDAKTNEINANIQEV